MFVLRRSSAVESPDVGEYDNRKHVHVVFRKREIYIIGRSGKKKKKKKKKGEKKRKKKKKKKEEEAID